jgi:hypothetical protein
MRGIEKAKKVFSVVMGNEVHKIKYARKIGQTSIDG